MQTWYKRTEKFQPSLLDSVHLRHHRTTRQNPILTVFILLLTFIIMSNVTFLFIFSLFLLLVSPSVALPASPFSRSMFPSLSRKACTEDYFPVCCEYSNGAKKTTANPCDCIGTITAIGTCEKPVPCPCEYDLDRTICCEAAHWGHVDTQGLCLCFCLHGSIHSGYSCSSPFDRHVMPMLGRSYQ